MSNESPGCALFAILLWLMWIGIVLSFWIGVIYIGWHFASKYW